MRTEPNRTATSVKGVLGGQASDATEGTGTTVLLFPRGALAAVEPRGGAPGTMHTDALAPLGCFGRLHGLFLTGGSLYGLDAARGIRSELLRRGAGARIFGSYDRVVSVSGAVLFDLPRDRPLRADYEELGRRAARTAGPKPLQSGSFGAGTGATVGKVLGRRHAMSGGIGHAAADLPRGFRVAAAVACNAVGNVVDPATGITLAGARHPAGGWGQPGDSAEKKGRPRPRRDLRELAGHEDPPRGTTLVMVATDLPMTRRDLARVAQSAHDGVARAVVPAHTATDGDTAFVVSTGEPEKAGIWPAGGAEPYPGAVADLVGVAVSKLVVAAILDAVRSSRGRPGLPSVADLHSSGEPK